MNKKYIDIECFKVDQEGERIIAILNIPKGYELTYAQLTAWVPQTGDVEYDILAALPNGKERIQFVLPMKELGIHSGGIYILNLKIENPADKDDYSADTAVCADVSFVYHCFAKELINLDCRCSKLSDDVITNYLIFYAYQSAIGAGNIDTAKDLYQHLTNCFKPCRSEVVYSSSNCGNHCNCGCL